MTHEQIQAEREWLQSLSTILDKAADCNFSDNNEQSDALQQHYEMAIAEKSIKIINGWAKKWR